MNWVDRDLALSALLFNKKAVLLKLRGMNRTFELGMEKL